VVRIGSLAAWPHNRDAGLKGLGRKLCSWADTQQVTLDLTARTPALSHKYAQDGFTQPDPTHMWMNRQPTTPRRERAGVTEL
jgi:hypothetical protein